MSLLFKKGATPDTDATGAIHIAFGIARSELPAWEAWLSQQGIPIEFRKTWKSRTDSYPRAETRKVRGSLPVIGLVEKAPHLSVTLRDGGEALYFRDPDGHLLEVVTPGVWSIF